MPTIEEISKAIRGAGMAAEQKQGSIDEALPGGEAQNKTPEQFDQIELQKGISVEMEHTQDKEVAANIAMDHLTEDPNYYKKLEEMEKGGVDKVTFARFAALGCSAMDRMKACLDLLKQIGSDWAREAHNHIINDDVPSARKILNEKKIHPIASRVLGLLM
jgi:hypothetical protein